MTDEMKDFVAEFEQTDLAHTVERLEKQMAAVQRDIALLKGGKPAKTAKSTKKEKRRRLDMKKFVKNDYSADEDSDSESDAAPSSSDETSLADDSAASSDSLVRKAKRKAAPASKKRGPHKKGASHK